MQNWDRLAHNYDPLEFSLENENDYQNQNYSKNNNLA